MYNISVNILKKNNIYLCWHTSLEILSGLAFHLGLICSSCGHKDNAFWKNIHPSASSYSSSYWIDTSSVLAYYDHILVHTDISVLKEKKNIQSIGYIWDIIYFKNHFYSIHVHFKHIKFQSDKKKELFLLYHLQFYIFLQVITLSPLLRKGRGDDLLSSFN